MVFAMDGWYTYTIIIGARNQHTASGAYEFHIHRAYIIYGITIRVWYGLLYHTRMAGAYETPLVCRSHIARFFFSLVMYRHAHLGYCIKRPCGFMA